MLAERVVEATGRKRQRRHGGSMTRWIRLLPPPSDSECKSLGAARLEGVRPVSGSDGQAVKIAARRRVGAADPQLPRQVRGR